ncbi:hypothetical protein V1522DRAFT_419240 [Lipomyces starkeyi]
MPLTVKRMLESIDVWELISNYSVLKCGQEGSLEPGVSLSGQRQAAWYTAGSSSPSSTLLEARGESVKDSPQYEYADSPPSSGDAYSAMGTGDKFEYADSPRAR